MKRVNHFLSNIDDENDVQLLTIFQSFWSAHGHSWLRNHLLIEICYSNTDVIADVAYVVLCCIYLVYLVG